MRNPLKIHFLASTYLLFTSTSVVAGPAGAAAGAGLKALDYRYFVAGGVCAATSHGITTPIDVVKTKMQAQPEVRKLYGEDKGNVELQFHIDTQFKMFMCLTP